MLVKPLKKALPFVLMASLILPTPVFAGAAQMGGNMEMELRAGLGDRPVIFSGDGVLSLDITYSQDPVALYIKTKIDTSMTGDETSHLRLDTAYMDYFSENFDLRFGKQRISWGTAVGFNPTDVINPVDIAHPMEDKLPNWALLGQYYPSPSWELSGVYLPFFKAGVDTMAIPGQPPIQIMPPDKGGGQGEWAVKLGAMGMAGVDASLMYFSGWERTPSIRMAPKGPEGYYREVSILGGDFATTIGDAGLWAEAAYNLPQDGDPYVNWVAGADYGLENGLKIVGQVLHQTNANVGHNYLMLGFERGFAVIHKWKIGAIYDLGQGDYLFNPELKLSLADGAEFTLGWKDVSRGRKGAPMKNMMAHMENEVYVNLAISF